MEWQQVLVKAVVSAAAGAVSTGVLVATAENGPGLPKRKKRRRKKGRRRRRPNTARGTNAAGDRERPRARKKKRRKKKSKKEAQMAADPGMSAARHLAEVSQPGLTTEEFFANLKSTGQGVKSRATRWLSGAPAPDEVPAAKDEVAEERGRRSSARGDEGRRPRRRQSRQDGLDALKEDAMYLAKDKVKQTVKNKISDATGVNVPFDAAGDAIDRVRETAGELGERAADVGRRIADGAQENFSSASEIADGMAESSKQFAGKVKESLPENTEEIERGLKGIGRWLQGPGAQNYDEGKRKELPRKQNTGVVVEARVDGEVPAAVLPAPDDVGPLLEAPEAPAGALPEAEAPELLPPPRDEGAPPPEEPLVETPPESPPEPEVVEARVDDDAPPPVRRHRPS